jgi:hypothetical protein
MAVTLQWVTLYNFNIAYISDNCWRENKNRFLFSFLASLMQLNIFVESTCSFLIKGHTGWC